jgi:hypothetical protein
MRHMHPDRPGGAGQVKQGPTKRGSRVHGQGRRRTFRGAFDAQDPFNIEGVVTRLRDVREGWRENRRMRGDYGAVGFPRAMRWAVSSMC